MRLGPDELLQRVGPFVFDRLIGARRSKMFFSTFCAKLRIPVNILPIETHCTVWHQRVLDVQGATGSFCYSNYFQPNKLGN